MAMRDAFTQVQELRNQGLSDTIIAQELKSSGFSPDQIGQALAQASYPSPTFSPPEASPGPQRMSRSEDWNYDRVEEIAENIIDEKWEQLIGEVKKVIEWKERMGEKIQALQQDVDKIKDDFKVLHQGVLGKLESYDSKMTDVGTELKAVGKVFQDVIPEFVENVKELRGLSRAKK
jgi:uncharacterized phage infection (PIP) family protein YhgE